MRITDRWQTGKPTISFELFPARTPEAAEKLDRVLDDLAALRPDFVSVTFGAGGSTRDGSRQLLDRLHNAMGLEVIAYFAGYGLSPADITAVLDSYRDLGIDNFLLVRGDPPREEGFQPHPDSFPHASDLVAFVRPRYPECLGVAGYPEGHPQAPSKEKDLEFLKLKVELGAEYIITNYCYDNRHFFDFTARCRAAGITVPILPGVMPIYSVKMMEMLAGICGATLPTPLCQRLAALPEGDKAALQAFGIDYAACQCAELLHAGVPGIHLYTMDRSEAAVGIVNRLRGEGLLLRTEGAPADNQG